MNNQVYQHQWIALDRDVRECLRVSLHIPRTGISEVRDQSIISDGVTNEDLTVLTLEALNAFIGSKEESLGRAWEIAVARAEFLVHTPPMVFHEGKATDIRDLPNMTKDEPQNVVGPESDKLIADRINAGFEPRHTSEDTVSNNNSDDNNEPQEQKQAGTIAGSRTKKGSKA